MKTCGQRGPCDKGNEAANLSVINSRFLIDFVPHSITQASTDSSKGYLLESENLNMQTLGVMATKKKFVDKVMERYFVRRKT